MRRGCGLKPGGDPTLAACRLAWSRALGDDPRARALREAARAAFVALGPGFTAEAAAAE